MRADICLDVRGTKAGPRLPRAPDCPPKPFKRKLLASTNIHAFKLPLRIPLSHQRGALVVGFSEFLRLVDVKLLRLA
jgi:hypothetical protein